MFIQHQRMKPDIFEDLLFVWIQATNDFFFEASVAALIYV